MPAKSAKQEKFMQAVAHSPSFAKKVGVPQSVGREFTTKKGAGMKKMDKGGMKKMAGGGLAAGHKSADGVTKKGKTKGTQVKMARGGMKGCK